MKTKRVLVTGASRGIGRAIALLLGKRGWDVAVHYSTSERDAQEVIGALGDAASGLYRCDLADPAQADSLVERVLMDAPLHAVVNNAGVYLQGSFCGSSNETFEATYRKTFAVNFESPMRITRRACQHFASQGSGKVLQVASRVGFKGEANAAVYAASKAALINLTRSLAVELAPKVQLFGIAPGWVLTAMAREGMDDREAEILGSIPLGRMAAPEDCAATAAFLLSDEASYLSGVVIDINGASYFH